MTAAPASARYVEPVMGMPISLALRGRHTADARAGAAWAEGMAVRPEAGGLHAGPRGGALAGDPTRALRPGRLGRWLDDRRRAGAAGGVRRPVNPLRVFSVHRSRYRGRSRAAACTGTTTDPLVRTTLDGMDIDFEAAHRADLAA